MISEVEEPPAENFDTKYNLEANILESEAELYYVRNSNYMANQPYIEPSMRTILMDWIMEVCSQFRFKRNTFHSAIMLIDIYLSKTCNVPTHLLQLIGVTCLCIASKNEVRLFILSPNINLIIQYNNIGSIYPTYGHIQQINCICIHYS